MIPIRPDRSQQDQRGFALLIVLWTLVLLTLLVTDITASAHNEAELAGNLRGAAVAEAAADGAVQTAIFHAIDTSPSHWPADGLTRRFHIGTASVAVRIVDEDGRVNLNYAQMPLLVALLRQVGADPARAVRIAGAILDWRMSGAQPSPKSARIPQYRAAGRAWGPPQEPFASVQELGLVLGMTPALLARLRPHLSVHTEGNVDPALADAVVLKALREAGDSIAPPLASPGSAAAVLRIAATAIVPGGARFARTAVVLLRAGVARILLWQSGDA